MQGGSHVFETGCAPLSRAHFAIKTGCAHIGSGTFRNKNWVCPHRSLSLSGPKTGCARAHRAPHRALKVTRLGGY